MNNDLKNFLEGDFIGNNVHSVYTHCLSCGAWGINLPLDKICGNCNKDTDTYTYYDKETVALHDTRLINFVLDLVEKEVENRAKLFIGSDNLDNISRIPEPFRSHVQGILEASTIINNLRV